VKDDSFNRYMDARGGRFKDSSYFFDEAKQNSSSGEKPQLSSARRPARRSTRRSALSRCLESMSSTSVKVTPMPWHSAIRCTTHWIGSGVPRFKRAEKINPIVGRSAISMNIPWRLMSRTLPVSTVEFQSISISPEKRLRVAPRRPFI